MKWRFRSTVILALMGAAIVFLMRTPPGFAPQTMALGAKCSHQSTFALAVHGGAVWGRSAHSAKEAHLLEQVKRGRARLADGEKAIDVITAIVASMEDSGLFNAGRGSVANKVGQIEMDASVMEGRHLRAGAVAGVRALKNPILAARLVMDNTPQVMFVGPAADAQLTKLGAQGVGPDYFSYSGHRFVDVKLPAEATLLAPGPSVSPRNSAFSGVWAGVLGGRLNHVLIVEKIDPAGADVIAALGANEELGLPVPVTVRARATFLNRFLIVETARYRIAYKFEKSGVLAARLAVKSGARASGHLRNRPKLIKPSGTVGAVALDRCGTLAAGTSTGGFGSKPPGRVGDTPIIGAGTYADNRSAAVSATGHGEYFVRHAVAHEVAARIRHGKQSLVQAAYQMIFKELKADGGKGGLIAIDKNGEVVMLYNTEGMVRGWTTDKRSAQVTTYAAE